MKPSRDVFRVARAAAVALVLLAPQLRAQAPAAPTPTPGRIRGTVVADSGGTPVVGAEVSLPGLDRKVRTDTAGQYDLPNLASGPTLVQVRAVGFRPDSTTVEVRDRLVVRLQLRLAFEEITVVRRGAAAQAQPLPTVTTEASASGAVVKLAEFNERRQIGVGRFLDRDQLAKFENRRTSDAFATMGSVQVKGGMRGWISNGRVNDATCALCNDREKGALAIVSQSDYVAGARAACYMDVWLDGTRVYEFGHTPPQPLFDVNQLQPQAIEGIEAYVGAASIPSKYNSSLSSQCGVILIWTRISPPKSP